MSLNSEACVQVVEDKSISSTEVHKNLSDFLGKKHVREGLSDDNYTRLQRIQKTLERELAVNADSADAQKPCK